MSVSQSESESDCAPDNRILALWQVHLLRKHVRYAFALHVLAAVLFLWLTANGDVQALVGWIGGFAIAWVIAGTLIVRAAAGTATIGKAAGHLRTMQIAIVAGSSPWQVAALILADQSTIGQLQVACLLTALAASTAMVLNPCFTAAAASVASIMLPASATLIFLGDTDAARLGILLAGMGMAIALSSRRSANMLLSTLRAQLFTELHNDELHEQIQSALLSRDAMADALAHAERSCNERARFLATASHDLRQPMHAVNLFVSALKAEVHGHRTRYLVDRLERSLTGLDSLFNRLLDISRLDIGTVVPIIKTIEAITLAQTIEAQFQPLAAAKSLDFRVFCGKRLLLRSDPDLLCELINNLMSNALRYTKQGGILLAFRSRAERVLIQVWDTGVGIAPEHMQRIFDEFVQLNNPERDRRKGLGLGLAIVRRLADLLGHRLEMRSRVGRGSCFELLVDSAPYESVAPRVAMAGGPREPPFAGALILVIEDEIDILAAMDALLTSWGCLCIVARTVDEAARYVDSSLRFPDVIISDHRLPDRRTSFDAAAAIARLMPYAIPMIVVSGESDATVAAEVARHGHVFMSKPIQVECLYGVVRDALVQVGETLRKAG